MTAHKVTRVLTDTEDQLKDVEVTGPIGKVINLFIILLLLPIVDLMIAVIPPLVESIPIQNVDEMAAIFIAFNIFILKGCFSILPLADDDQVEEVVKSRGMDKSINGEDRAASVDTKSSQSSLKSIAHESYSKIMRIVRLPFNEDFDKWVNMTKTFADFVVSTGFGKELIEGFFSLGAVDAIIIIAKVQDERNESNESRRRRTALTGAPIEGPENFKKIIQDSMKFSKYSIAAYGVGAIDKAKSVEVDGKDVVEGGVVTGDIVAFEEEDDAIPVPGVSPPPFDELAPPALPPPPVVVVLEDKDDAVPPLPPTPQDPFAPPPLDELAPPALPPPPVVVVLEEKDGVVPPPPPPTQDPFAPPPLDELAPPALPPPPVVVVLEDKDEGLPPPLPRGAQQERGISDDERKRKTAEYVGVDVEDIIRMGDLGGDIDLLGYFIAVDRKAIQTGGKPVVVLALRGTATVGAGAKSDAAGYTREYCDGLAHTGIADRADKIWDHVKGDVIKTLKANRGFDFIITGHSLGAGAAALLTFKLKHGNLIAKEDRSLRFVKVLSFVFAPPPVYLSNEDMEDINEKDMEDTYAFIHENDCVPFASVDSVRRLAAVVDEVDAATNRVIGPLMALGAWGIPTRVKDLVFGKNDDLPFMKGAEKLAIPAPYTFWLRQFDTDDKGRPIYNAMFCRTQAFGSRPGINDLNIFLDKDMVNDHMPAGYYAAVNSIGKQITEESSTGYVLPDATEITNYW